MNTELRDYLRVAIEAAHLGAAQLEHWRTRFKVREKAPADLVTDADHASQQAVRDHLLREFPDHQFLGEEECFGKAVETIRLPADAPPTWIVDPLDGTVNYVHDVPAYCVSIGLWMNGEPTVGVIYDPRMKELFSAAQGQGAFRNDEPIRVSPCPTITGALVSTGFPAEYEAQMRNLEAWRRVTRHTQALRRTGSTALNLAYVASGRFDGYWAYDNWPWDVLAGAVLVTEAGGRISTADGQPFDPFRMDICATNGTIHDSLLSALQSE